MRRITVLACAVAVVVPLGLAARVCEAGPLAQSTFDADGEGWSLTGDVTGFSWMPGEGVPPGCIRGVDVTTGDTWYFVAPAKFLGDKGAAYGDTLSYDIWISTSDGAPWASPCITFFGAADLHYYGLFPPVQQWTHFAVDLTATSGWLKSDGTAPTEQEMRQTLAALTGLHIRGEYRTGSDYGYLDNVILTPEPATLALVALGAVGLAARRRRK